MASVEINPDEEHERVAIKYGQEAYSDVYGNDSGARLREVINSAKPGRKPKHEAADTVD